MAGAHRGHLTPRLPYLRKFFFLVSRGVAFMLQKEEASHNTQKLLYYCKCFANSL